MVGIPEDQVDMLRKSPEVNVKLWVNQSRSVPAKVHEIAPAADPVIRTYIVKISVSSPPPGLKLGVIAAITLVRPGGSSGSGGMGMRMLMSVLPQDQDRDMVQLCDAVSQTVKPVPVTVGTPRDNVLLVKSGLQPGQTIVTAGVRLLKTGQKVVPTASVDQPPAQSTITSCW